MSKTFRRGKWRKLLKEMACADCSLSCDPDVECIKIEEFLNMMRDEVKR